MRADAGAAAGEIFVDTLEHVDIPADRTQKVRREQPTDRAADDQCAGLGHPLLPRVRRFSRRPARLRENAVIELIRQAGPSRGWAANMARLAAF